MCAARAATATARWLSGDDATAARAMVTRHAHSAARAAAKAKRAKVPNLCTHCWECQVSDIFIRAESRVRLRAAYLASCPAHTEWAVAGGGRPPPNSLTALGCPHRVGTAESRTWHE